MNRTHRRIRAVAAAGVLALVAAPTALAAPGGVPGKPPWAGKPAGAPGGGPTASVADGPVTTDAVDGSTATSAPATAGNGYGNKPGGPRVAYVFKGTYEGSDTVAVSGGNKRGRALAGESVLFDFSSAKISVADTSLDGVMDLSDVLVGDAVLVQARLPKREPLVQPIPARHLVDQTNPAPEDPVETEPTL